MDPTFAGTREYNLVVKLLEALENESAEEFSQALADFDKMTKLDEWKTSLLLRVKKSIDVEDFT
jgi:alpha-soluble NSF attachment protein